jgi:hypothetical protein
MSGTQYIGNPFQVLGKSDPAPSAADLDAVAAEQTVKDMTSGAAPGAGIPVPEQSAVPVEKSSASVASVVPVEMPAPPTHPVRHFFHTLGEFFLNDALPVALQIAIPILKSRV